MKKNFIFVLTLLLSTVATLKITSCNTDDDFDVDSPTEVRSNAEKAATPAYFSNALNFNFNGADGTLENKQKGGEIVRSFLTEKLAGLADSVTVDKRAFCIYAKSGAEESLSTKLQNLSAETQELTDALQQELPSLVGVRLDIYPVANPNEILFSYTFLDLF